VKPGKSDAKKVRSRRGGPGLMVCRVGGLSSELRHRDRLDAAMHAITQPGWVSMVGFPVWGQARAGVKRRGISPLYRWVLAHVDIQSRPDLYPLFLECVGEGAD
jgi:hypothetical protein